MKMSESWTFILTAKGKWGYIIALQTGGLVIIVENKIFAIFT